MRVAIVAVLLFGLFAGCGGGDSFDEEGWRAEVQALLARSSDPIGACAPFRDLSVDEALRLADNATGIDVFANIDTNRQHDIMAVVLEECDRILD